MAKQLRGAYVRAWVWVDWEDDSSTNDEIAQAAKDFWHKEGEIEIDLPIGSHVSRSYEEG